MTITKTEPYLLEEIEQLKEVYGNYIKTVIDTKKKVCVAGVVMHVDGEQILLNQGSKQSDIWGGGIDTITKDIDFQSMINIRSSDNNPSNIITNIQVQTEYAELTKYFFKEIYGE
jgi:hypothetical protein